MVVRREQSLRVEVPGAANDHPRVGRVGVVAAVGFAIGILWPWLAGVRLVPSLPAEGGPRLATESAPQPSASATPPPVPQGTSSARAAQKSTRPEPAERVRIGNASVTSCRDAQGKQVEPCGTVNLDAMAAARLRALGGCQGAEEANGMLSLGLELDFQNKRVGRLLRGASTTLPDRTTEKLLACARKEFQHASLDGVEHAHASYTVFYLVEFLPPGKPAEQEESEAGESADEMTQASGMATVSWDVALIRESANQESALKARLRSGTRVVVVGRRGEWYRVKYDAKGSEGWVYKSAIGL